MHGSGSGSGSGSLANIVQPRDLAHQMIRSLIAMNSQGQKTISAKTIRPLVYSNNQALCPAPMTPRTINAITTAASVNKAVF